MWFPIIVTAAITSLIHLFVVAPVLFWSLNARLERTMDKKLEQQKAKHDETYAPKAELDTLKADMKKVVSLFERIDTKLDRFLTTKPA